MTELIPRLAVESDTKLVLLVLDGVGGIRTAERATELEEAKTPNLDKVAAEGVSGLHTVVSPGVTPGSGAGHLALFGYDPLIYELGRGALSAAGVGFQLQPGDVAARVNFCTIDEEGLILDRRAGRIPTEVNIQLTELLVANVDLAGEAELFIVPEREHRALLVLRGKKLSPEIWDTDPQHEGLAPMLPTAIVPEAERTASILRKVLDQARNVLSGRPANFLLLRGFDTLRAIPQFGERYRLKAKGIAGYPMYIGIARLLGMDVASPQPSFESTLEVLETSWQDFDYFYLHVKRTDSAGEDGDYDAKIEAIEQVDTLLPRLLELGPHVLCVTGDHATPAALMMHSWHPVPFVMWGPRVGVDDVTAFNESAAREGGYGQVMGRDLMPLMLAAGARLAKFGA